jgi:hypothetical protein
MSWQLANFRNESFDFLYQLSTVAQDFAFLLILMSNGVSVVINAEMNSLRFSKYMKEKFW